MNNFRGGFGGGFGGANMNALMQQAKKLQEEMARAKEELEATEFSATVGGGAVTIVLFGNKKVKSIILKPEVVDPDDKEMLEDLISAAFNDCISQIENVEAQNAPAVPGLF